MKRVREIREEFSKEFGVSSELDWPEIREKLEETDPKLFENRKPVNVFLNLFQVIIKNKERCYG